MTQRGAQASSYRVRSIKYSIVKQFAIIITPITLVLLVQVYIDIHHAKTSQIEETRSTTAHAIRDDFRDFLNGAADAADTGRLSEQSLSRFERATRSMKTMTQIDKSPNLMSLIARKEAILTALRSDPSLESLLKKRQMINLIDQQLNDLVDESNERFRQKNSNFVKKTTLQVQLMLAAFVVTLIFAGLFLYKLIKELTEPLGRAVTLASEIADGNFEHADEEHSGADIEGLLGSLGEMRKALNKLFTDLERNENRLANAQRIAGLGDWEMDLNGKSAHWSPKLYEIFEYPANSMPSDFGIPIELVHMEDRELVTKALNSLHHSEKDFDINFRITLPSGLSRHLHAIAAVTKTACIGSKISGTIQDISEHMTARQQLQHVASHDALTGLPNRSCFLEQVDLAIAAAARSQGTLEIMFLDLDNFKKVNDSLGHSVGDALLVEVSLRIIATLRKSDVYYSSRSRRLESIIARLGGDEFTVLLPASKSTDDTARLAQRIIDSIAEPYQLEGHKIYCTISIGVAAFPNDGPDVATLIRHADAAMYCAKTKGRNNYQFFTESMNIDTINTLVMESDLRKALAEEQFVLHYQPKFYGDTRKIYGVEALIRWQHPEKGLIYPGEFIPLAEARGLIVAIGEWVLKEACFQAKSWHDAGFDRLTIAVNLAAPSFKQANLLDYVNAVITDSGLAPEFLEIEVTESTMMDDLDRALPALYHLKSIGIQLSMDDFGTGYSSLSYLQKFPLDTLKIDRSFVENLDAQEGSAIALAIIAIAQSLELKVIAEGVETEAQMNFLLESGCVEMQGFLLSKPLTAASINAILPDQYIGLKIDSTTSKSTVSKR
jgi:diguanylate cyclase (GGDEF)-like protein